MTILGSCTVRARHWSLPEVAKVSDLTPGTIKGYENHPDVRFCGDFRLSEMQVLEFLRKARQITQKEQHDEFDWSPCVMRGRVLLGKEEAKWEISATLVGSLKLQSGQDLMLGCDRDCAAAVGRADSQ